MKKIIGIMLSILMIAIALVLFTVIKSNEEANRQQLQEEMQTYLEKGEYNSAYAILSQQSEDYEIFENIALNQIKTICNQAKSKLDIQEIDKIISSGFNYDVLYETKGYIQNKINKIEESKRYYEKGIISYDQKDYEIAKNNLEKVIQEDTNYYMAQNLLEEISQLQKSWSATDSARSMYKEAIAFDGEYLYFAHTLNYIDGIYKMTPDGKNASFIPLNSGGTRAKIYSINIVGEYIYFIAGQNIGSGYVFKNTYNIYKMKKDGTDLSLEVKGNFTALYIEKDEAYAISRDYGLVKFSKYLSDYEIVSDKLIMDFSYTSKGIYYTQRESLEYDGKNSIYFFDGDSKKEIDAGEHMHYYSFADKYLKLWTKTDASEILNIGYGDEETRIRMTDIGKVYGIVDNKVLYSGFGLYQQERLYCYDIETKENKNLGAYATVMEYEIKGIFYEYNKILIEKGDKLYLSNIEGDTLTEIAAPEVLENLDNTRIKKLINSDIYLEKDNEIIAVIEDKQIWLYKSDELNLYIEKRYIEQYDTNVYITHIFTNNFSLFKTGNGGDKPTDTDTYRAYEISDKYHAIYAQSGDTFLDGRNAERGIVIRDSEIIRDELTYDIIAVFDDGSMETYHKTDEITAQQLLDMGAHTTFAFGPILVENYKTVPECAYDELAVRNPRSAIGYVEPGHYVMIVCDGRDEEVSRGLSMIQLANLFEEEGCKTAYNLDGGTTSTITFFGNYITRRTAYPNVPEIYNHRMVAELFYVGTSSISPTELDVYTYDYSFFLDNIK